MKAFSTLFLLVFAGVVWGQQFPTMPERLFPKEVEYADGLPSLEVESGVRGVNNLVLSREPSNLLVTGSAPRARMIVLNKVEQVSENCAKPQSETNGPTIFYLKDNIWDESRRSLEKMYPPPPQVKNSAVWQEAYKTSQYNQVEVMVWKLKGIIRDTKMPKGYKLFVAPK